MGQINPFTYAVVQNVQAQRQAAVEKERQLRRASAMQKDIAAHDDELEHQVESSEEVRPVKDEEQPTRERPKRRPPQCSGKDGKPHIDLTA